MSVYEKVFDHLKADDFKAFPPGTHKGDCTTKYVVVLDGGKSQINGFSSQTAILDILCYVPGNRYTDLNEFVSSVKKSLAKMFPQIVPTGTETSPFADDTNKSWMVSVEYRYTVRNKQLR